MRKRWLGVLGGLLLVVLVAALFWLKQQPSWNPAYFTPDMRQRYTTPQDCFAQYVRALRFDDAAHYNEVLGYDGAQDTDSPRFQGETPEIAKLTVEGDHAFIWTANRWEVNLRYVSDRWVFEPESFSLLVRRALSL